MPPKKKIPKTAPAKRGPVPQNDTSDNDIVHIPQAAKRKVCDAVFNDESDDEKEVRSDESFVSCNQNLSTSRLSGVTRSISSIKSSPIVCNVENNDIVKDVRDLLLLILTDMDKTYCMYQRIASFKSSRAFFLTFKLPAAGKARSVKQDHYNFVFFEEFKNHMNNIGDSYFLEKFLFLMVYAQNIAFFMYPNIASNVRFSSFSLSFSFLTHII